MCILASIMQPPLEPVWFLSESSFPCCPRELRTYLTEWNISHMIYTIIYIFFTQDVLPILQGPMTRRISNPMPLSAQQLT